MGKKENTRREAVRQQKGVDIDMNPMVDLAFLLLTFFMLTTTFSKPQAMELRMPVKANENEVEKEQPVKESKTMTLIPAEEDRLFWFTGITDPDVQETKYSAEGIRDLLLQKKAEIEGLVVLVKPVDGANFKNVVDILDELAITEVERFAIVDITPRDLELIAEEP